MAWRWNARASKFPIRDVLRVPKELARPPWDFVLYDPSKDTVIHIAEKPEEWQSHQQLAEDVGRSISESHRPLSLVLHHDALALHKIPRYAAMVELD